MSTFQSFYLAGHSFGGYISSHYALRFPEYIKKLILISPIGIKDPNIEIEEEIGELQRQDSLMDIVYNKTDTKEKGKEKIGKL